MAFEYSNLNDRAPGRLFRLVRRVLPGVGLVENEIKPYAVLWQERNLDALAATDPLWVVLGDSLSQGVGASSVEHGWVPQTARALAGRGVRYRILNLSFSGARVSDVLDRQLPALAGLSAVPELVTVLIGSNDIISQVSFLHPHSARTGPIQAVKAYFSNSYSSLSGVCPGSI
ncbi:MAG TPA: SGNH/GDSL hydrolase family protein [Trebonia sp.]